MINIFILNILFYDGVVIIRDGKIKAAVCFLFLFENRYISKEFGIWYRAVFGIFENFDVIVIVVLEEIGIIFVVYNGGFIRNLGFEVLRKIFFRFLK